MPKIVALIDEVLTSCSTWLDPQAKSSDPILAPKHLSLLAEVRAEVLKLTDGRPLFAY